MRRSGCCTVVGRVEVLFPLLGSALVLSIVAVLVRTVVGPDPKSRPLTAITPLCPTFRLPIDQISVPVDVWLPVMTLVACGIAALNWKPAGRVSVTTTLVAMLGPLFT